MPRNSDRTLLLEENDEDEEEVYRAKGLKIRKSESSMEVIDLSGSEEGVLRARNSTQNGSISLQQDLQETHIPNRDSFVPRDFLEQILNIKNTFCCRAFQCTILYLTFLVNVSYFFFFNIGVTI